MASEEYAIVRVFHKSMQAMYTTNNILDVDYQITLKSSYNNNSQNDLK